MKKMATYAVSAAMIMSFNVALPSAATAGAKNQVDACKVAVENEVFESVGACVSEVRTRPTRACKFLDQAGILDLINIKNRGQCIKVLGDLIAPE